MKNKIDKVITSEWVAVGLFTWLAIGAFHIYARIIFTIAGGN